MIKLIIFDWDDVFTQGSKKGYFKCYDGALREVDVYLKPSEKRRRILAKWGKSHIEVLSELLKEKPELIDKACKVYEQHLFGNTFIEQLSLIPASKELLVRLSKKYSLAIATGIHPKILKEKVFIKFKIPKVFGQIISAYDLDDQNKAKPNPYMLKQIMKNQNSSPKETLFVGDAENDVIMARNAGVEPIVVLTGHLNKDEANRLDVSYILEDVMQIEKVLSELD